MKSWLLVKNNIQGGIKPIMSYTDEAKAKEHLALLSIAVYDSFDLLEVPFNGEVVA